MLKTQGHVKELPIVHCFGNESSYKFKIFQMSFVHEARSLVDAVPATFKLCEEAQFRIQQPSESSRNQSFVRPPESIPSSPFEAYFCLQL